MYSKDSVIKLGYLAVDRARETKYLLYLLDSGATTQPHDLVNFI